MNSIKARIFYSAQGNAKIIKALALAIYIKKNYVSSSILNYTIHKLHEITGLSYSSLKSRTKTLKELGLIRFDGVNSEHLVINSLTTKKKYHRIDLSKIVCNSVKNIEKSLNVLFIVEIQKRKDFVKHSIKSAFDPTTESLEEIKKARRLCRCYGYDKEYKEYGLSYKTIAKRLNVCVQKAVELIKFAVEYEILGKMKHVKQIFSKGIGYAKKYCDFSDFTFCTTNNAYIVYANSYRIIGN